MGTFSIWHWLIVLVVVLVLFGGGLSLARGMDQSGLAAWIGGVVGSLDAVPTFVIIAFVATLVGR